MTKHVHNLIIYLNNKGKDKLYNWEEWNDFFSDTLWCFVACPGCSEDWITCFLRSWSLLHTEYGLSCSSDQTLCTQSVLLTGIKPVHPPSHTSSCHVTSLFLPIWTFSELHKYEPRCLKELLSRKEFPKSEFQWRLWVSHDGSQSLFFLENLWLLAMFWYESGLI